MITDPESVVPIRRASDSIPAFATGKGDGTLQLRLLTLGLNPLKVGDAFVTSGSGGLYWPNTPIAVVTALTRDGAIARVLGDPAVSEMVAVLPTWSPDSDPRCPAGRSGQGQGRRRRAGQSRRQGCQGGCIRAPQ
jgi:rod shape-determining protein MreC